MTTEADATVTTSKTFGKYRVLSVIGQGGMGVVYKAFDTTIERIVAVKTLHGGSLSGDMAGELRERFKRDAQAGGRLTHPNIAAVYEFGEAQGNAFIAMEFVEGRTLKQALEQGERFALAESVRIVREVLAALAHAHQRGVIHRDIKPANIVLTPAGAVKIIDFGIAHLDSSTMTVTGAMLGTPMYMAPEQVQGLPVTAAADIFAAGVVLYELLTNDQPFAAANTATTMRKVLDVVPVRPSRLSVAVPEWLDAVLEKAMAKNPADRFPTAEAFAEALRGPIAASPSSPRQAQKRAPAPRKPARLAAVAVALLLSAGLAATAYRFWPAASRGDPVPAAAVPAATVSRPVAAETPRPAESVAAAVAPSAAVSGQPALIRDCPVCPELVVIGPGRFLMGSSEAETTREGIPPNRAGAERPQHWVTIDYPLAVGRTPVTFAEWDACVADGGCTYRPGDEGWGREARPVINVSWQDTQVYLSWLSEETGRTYRLLSEAEWEYIARAGTTTARWWGDDIGHGNANCDGCGSPWDMRQTAPVGGIAAGQPFGVADILGNVSEWTRDCYHDTYVGAPTDGSAWTVGECNRRIVRGGAWNSFPRQIRSAFRVGSNIGNRVSSCGFRVARNY